LRQVQATALDESSFEQLLQLGHTQESSTFQSEIQFLESDYAALADMQHRGERSSANLEQELDRLQHYLAAARRDLQRTQSDVRSGAQMGAAYRGPTNVGDDGTPLFRAHTRRGV
jgi:hypothetical protein